MPSYDFILRDYTMDDLLMMEKAQVFHDNFIVDKLSFTTAFPGLVDPFAANFQTAINTADAIPPDSEVVQQIAVLTEQLEVQMEVARKAIQKLFVYVKVAFNDSQAYLKLFGKSQYDKARTNQLRMKELLEKANRQANLAANKAPLIAAGFTQVMIDGLLTIMNAIDAANSTQEDAKSERYKKTEDRVKAYNTVWGFMVRISEASKVVYVDSPAKLAEYLLYPSSSNLPHKVQNLQYTVLTHTASWDAAENAVLYELVYKTNGPIGNWLGAYEGVDTQAVHNPGPGLWLYRCRGKNNEGNGDWSDEKEVVN